MVSTQKYQQQYLQEKKKLFSNASSLFSSPDSIAKILQPLAEKKDNSSISLGDVTKSAVSGGFFALNNIISITSLLRSAPYYIEEAKKISNRKQKNAEKTSFFLQLLDDKDTTDFIKNNSDSIGKVLDKVAPTITSIIFREIGKLDELTQTLTNTEKQFGTLVQLQESLKNTKEKTKNKETIDNVEQ